MARGNQLVFPRNTARIAILTIALQAFGPLPALVPQAWADAAASPSPSPSASASPKSASSGATLTLDGVCGDVLGKTQLSSELEQKYTYCAAAKDASHSASSNGMLWKIWAAAAGVCLTECISSSLMGGAGKYVCVGANAGAGVTDAAVTKQFTAALSSLTGVGMSLALPAVTGAGKKGANGAPKSGSQRDWGACLAAATSSMQSFTKHQAMSDANKTVQSNLAQAAALDSGATAVPTPPPYVAPTPLAVISPVVTPSQGPGSLDPGAVAAQEDPGCTQAASSGSAIAMVQCASKTGPVPSIVSHPNFPDQFKKSSGGANLADFLKSSAGGSPSNAIPEVAQAGLASSDVPALANALGEVAKATALNTLGSGYAGGGGGGHSGGGDNGDAEFAAMMGNVLGALKPKPDPSASPGVDFAKNGPKRGLASQRGDDDPSESIFSRVTRRYQTVTERLR